MATRNREQRTVKRKLIVEMLESRRLMAIEITMRLNGETKYHTEAYWHDDVGTDWPWFVASDSYTKGDVVKIKARYENTGFLNQIPVVFSYENGINTQLYNLPNLDRRVGGVVATDFYRTGEKTFQWTVGDSKSFAGEVYGDLDGALKIDFPVPNPGSKFTIDLDIIPTGNLTALEPVFLSSGDLRYGFAQSGEVRIIDRAFVEVKAYYATGPSKSDIIETALIAGHELRSPFERTIPSEILRSRKPANATHIVVIVDEKNKAIESNESWGDNLKYLRLPDLYVNKPEITSDLSLQYSYGVTNPHASFTAPDPFVALYYADINGVLIGEVSGSKREVRVQDGGLRTLSLPPTSLESLPDGTAKIIALIDGPGTNLIIETDEANNRAELVLPDELLNAKLLISKPIVPRSDEGIDVPYEIAIGDLPRGKKAAIEVYWSETEGVPLGKPTAAKPQIVDLKTSSGTATFSAADLGRSWNGEKYLVARVRALGGIEASKYENNSRRLDVSKNPTRVSAELDVLLRREAAPARIRVAEWLSRPQISSMIRQTAKRFQIPPEALAGAVVYEALTDFDELAQYSGNPTKNLGDLNPTSYDAYAVEQTIYRGKKLTPRTEADRASYIGRPSRENAFAFSPAATFEYISAIMNAYATEAEKNKFKRSDVRNNPAMLISLYENVQARGDLESISFESTGLRGDPNVQQSNLAAVGSLRARVNQYPVDFSTGTTITPLYVLTAGHSIEESAGFADHVFVLGTDRLVPSGIAITPEIERLAGNIQPGDYKLNNKIDFGLFRLQNAIADISPIPIARSSPAVGDTLEFAHWQYDSQGVFRIAGSNTVNRVNAPALRPLGDPPYTFAGDFFNFEVDGYELPRPGGINSPYFGGAVPPLGYTYDVYPGDSGAPAFKQGVPGIVGVVSKGQAVWDDFASRFESQFSEVERNFIRDTIGREVSRSGNLTLGESGYYFAYLQDRKTSPTRHGEIAGWMSANSAFLKQSIKAKSIPALSVLRGDVDDDETVSPSDRPALSAAISNVDDVDDQVERTRLLSAGDLNRDGQLDSTDLAILDLMISDYDDVNDPETLDDEFVVRAATANRLSPLVNDVLPRGSGATITSFTQPSNGSLTVDPTSPNTRLLYTPKSGFSGIDTFSYTVTDRLGFSSTSDVSLVPTRPATPSAIKVSEIKADSVKLEWKQNSNNELGFRIAISRDNQATWDNVAVTGPDVTSVVIPNLRPDTPYFFKMRAANAGGYSDYTAVTRVVRTLPLPPTAPTDFMVKNVLAFSAELSWKNTSSNVTKFVISKSSDNGATWSSAGSASSVSANASVTVSVSGLTPLTKYKFRLVAVNRGGNSPEVFTPEVTTVSEIPVAPSDLAVQYRWAENIQFTWKDNSVVEAGYRLMGSSNGGATWRTWSFGRNVDRERADALTEATDYIFKVVAFNSYGSAESSTISVRTKLKAPIDFRVGDVNAYSIQVHWAPQSAAALGYRIYKSTDGGNTYGEPTTVAANATGRTLDNLQDRTTYVIKIVAFDNVSESDPLISVPIQTLKGRPAAPTNLVAQTIWPKTVQFAWNDNSDNEDNFKLMGSRDGGITWTTWLFDPNVARGRAEDLLESTDYVFKLVASNHWGTTESNTVQLRTKLSAPADLVVSDINAYSIQVRWTDVSSAETGFKVSKSVDGGVTFSDPETTPINQTGWTLRDLQDRTTYIVKIVAFDDTQESAALISGPITTLKGRPAAPTNLAVQTIWPKTIQFVWDDNSDNEDAFKLLGSANGGATWVSWNFLANENRGRAENLSESTDYIFKLQAINHWGVTESNIVSAHTKLSAPTDLVVSDINAYSIQIRWTDTSSVESGFKIFKSTDGGNSYGAPEVTGANQTGWTLRDLQDQTTYVIKVVAFNSSDESAALTSGAIRTLKGRPDAPSNLVAQTVWAKTVQFAWNDNSDNEAFFRLMGSSDGGATWSAWDFAAGETRGRAENLAESTDYIFKVVAFNSYGGAESELVSVHTKIAAPTDLRIATLRSTSVDLNWNDNSSREAEFIVMLSTNGVDFFEVRREAANRLSTRISNLRANTRYWTKIVAVNSTDNAESNILSFTTAR